MRFLHTSDWHLGRTLHGVDLLDAQRQVLAQVVALVADPPDGVPIDAVLVAGDIYDRAVPGVEAVGLLHETLAALTQHTTVVLTAGNHDSAIRLGFGSGLFRDRLHIRTRLDDLGAPVMVGPVAVYPVPYLDPDVARTALATADGPLARSHQAVMTAAVQRCRADLAQRPAGTPAVLLAHAFVVGGEPSASERSIVVGGVDSVAAETFAGLDYVALGHLHGPQQLPLSTAGVIQYSGSILRYSFSERRQQKSVTLVDIAPGHPVATTSITLRQPREMADLRGELADLVSGAGHDHDWVRLVVTDRVRPERLFEQAKRRFPHLLQLVHEPAGSVDVLPSAGPDSLELSVDALCNGFVEHVTGFAASELERALFERSYADALADTSPANGQLP